MASQQKKQRSCSHELRALTWVGSGQSVALTAVAAFVVGCSGGGGDAAGGGGETGGQPADDNLVTLGGRMPDPNDPCDGRPTRDKLKCRIANAVTTGRLPATLDQGATDELAGELVGLLELDLQARQGLVTREEVAEQLTASDVECARLTQGLTCLELLYLPSSVTSSRTGAMGSQQTPSTGPLTKGEATGYDVGFDICDCVVDPPDESRDLDRDLLLDDCELKLAQAFAPHLYFSASEAPESRQWRPYWAAGFWNEDADHVVRVFYALSYLRDLGVAPEAWSGFPAGWGDHDGDSEFIVVELLNAGGGRWSLVRAYLSAHFDTINDLGGWHPPKSDPSLAPNVFVSKWKHANYGDLDSCNRRVDPPLPGIYTTGDFCDLSIESQSEFVVVESDRNLGSKDHPLVSARVIAGRKGEDCSGSGAADCGYESYWDELRFCGWQVAASDSRRSCVGPDNTYATQLKFAGLTRLQLDAFSCGAGGAGGMGGSGGSGGSCGSGQRQEAYVKASNTGIDDWFGAHVAIDGNTMVIGAPGEDSNGAVADNSEPSSGAAYVFDRGASGTWVQTAYLKGTIGSGDVFGSSVAIEGDTIVVGAPAEDSDDDSILNVGNAYIFERVVGIWTQTADLQAPAVEGANFGWSVAVAGDHVVVGAPFERSTFTNGGAVHVFKRSDDGWGLARSIKGSNTGAGDEFGASVAISGNTLVVGAAGEDSPSIGVNGEEIDDVFFAQSGAVYVFEGSGAAWSQTTYVKASNTGHSDRFGHSVAIDGDILAVSAPFEDSPATGVNSPEQGDDPLSTHSGAVYVFERSDGGTWSQTAYVKASNAGGSDLFGGIGGSFRSFGKNAVASIALSGNALLVGASAEDSAATGIDCDDSNDNDNAGQAGAAYLFELIGDAWVQTAYIKASNTGDGGGRFGGSVALDGSLGVVGAFSENSAASGVGGDQSDSSAGNNSGAAYVFVLTP